MLHIIQNDSEVPPGLVAKELDQLGIQWALVHPYRGEPLPCLDATSGVIVMGGAMGANDDRKHPFLAGLKSFIREAVTHGTPYLGICLGGQLLAAAMGAEVRSNSCGEKGTLSVMLTEAGVDDRLFRGIGPEFISFQWHNDSFSVPKGAVRLAFSGICPNQAFRLGEQAWGVQFHPEVNEEIVREWSSWTRETAVRSDEFVAAYKKCETAYCEVSRRLMKNFLEIAGIATVSRGT